MSAGELILTVARLRVAVASLDDMLAQYGQSIRTFSRRGSDGPTPAAMPTALFEVRVAVAREVAPMAAEAFQAATGRPAGLLPEPLDGRVAVSLDVLAAAARSLPREHSAALVDDLAVIVDRAERSACVPRPPVVPLSGLDCPSCRLRTLRLRLDSQVQREMVVECRNGMCGCWSRCGCGGGRLPGRRHVWAVWEWGELCGLLGVGLGALSVFA